MKQKLKGLLKHQRTQRLNKHTPHFVVVLQNRLIPKIFDTKYEANMWAETYLIKNVYYEIHKDYFVE